jgi:interferon gamma-inducible protein 30
MDAYHKLGPEVVDLEIIPFGNAHLDELNQEVICQHGVAECDANTWEQCAVEMYAAPTYVEFIGCLEKVLPMGSRDTPFPESTFSNCADEAGIDFDIIKKCHDNPLQAWLLQKDYSKKTPMDHKFVPWVLINEKFWDEDKDNFLEVICKEYSMNGGSHTACSSATLN